MKQGRKLPLKYCVKNPGLNEILSALCAMGFKAVIEPKKTRPNDFLHSGRIKFRMYDAHDDLVNEEFKSKTEVMRAVGTTIVNSKIRQTPELRVAKEREGVFDMEKEE